MSRRGQTRQKTTQNFLSSNRMNRRYLRLVPGGGVEPPRAEARRILSPLRLPVPPSRHFVEVLDFTTCLWLCSLFIQNDECANCVRKCVSFLGFPQLVVILPVKRFAGDCRAKSPLPSHKKAPARDSTISLRAA